MKQYFKTTKVHHCFSQELNEPQPKKCKCRKFISREFASDLVKDGVADWIIKYPEGVASYDVVLKGIVGKTPRAQTIEKAHIERYIDQIWNLGFDEFLDPESLDHWDKYHDIEITERLKLFRNVGMELVSMKQASDNHGTLTGEAGHVLHNKIIKEADDLKAKNYKADDHMGEPVLMMIGLDERTTIGKDVAPGKEKLDKGF